MTDQAMPPLGEKDRLQVLLTEYTSVRNDTISRGAATYAMLTAGVAAVGVTVALLNATQPAIGRVWYLLLVFFVLALGAPGLIAVLDIRNMNKRTVQLEKKINEMIGEPLMGWQSDGGGVFGRALRGVLRMRS